MITNLVLLEASAAGAGDAGGAGVMNIIMIVALIAIFYFFMIRPQQKRQKEIRKFRESLTVGDRIITAGGIHGKIKGLKDNAFIIEIADNVRITVDKGSVYPSAADAQLPEENK